MMYKLLSLICIFCILIPFVGSAKIVFVSTRDGNAEIYVMEDDGTGAERITTSPLADKSPAWSPDGTQIAFRRVWFRGGGTGGVIERSEVFIMNRDGSAQQSITAPLKILGYASSPGWSPDGQHLAFAANDNKELPSNNIFVIRLGSEKVTKLTNNKVSGVSAYSPDWSSDGKHIVYIQSAPRLWRTVYTMTSNGKNWEALIPEDGVYRLSPRWSADGKSILFGEGFGDAKEGFDQVVIQQWGVKKSRRVLKTPKTWVVGSLCWMGRKHVLIAAYERDKSKSPYDIYQYNLFTDKIVNLTNSRWNDRSMDWINDSVLSVEPIHKDKTQWGELKEAEK